MLRIKELFTKILTAISGKVDKSGDTMTGDLTLEDSIIHAKAPFERDVVPSATEEFFGYYLDDENGQPFGYINAKKMQDGKEGIQVGTLRTVNGTVVTNWVYISVDANGNPIIEVENSPAWRTALNAVNKSGDTMTGSLSVNTDGTHDYYINNRVRFTKGTAPSSNTARGGFVLNDQNGSSIGRMDAYFWSNGYEGIRVGTSRTPTGGTAVGNYVHLGINDSGAKTVMFSDVAPWKTALGINNWDNTWISTSTAANIVTANTTNATIDSAYYGQTGHMAMLYIQWKNKAAITISTAGVVTDTVVGTIVTGKRPRALCNAFGRESNGLTYSIPASGVITLVSGNGGAAAKTIAANTVNNLYVCYMV